MLRRDFLTRSVIAASLIRFCELDSFLNYSRSIEKAFAHSLAVGYPELIPESGQLFDYSSCSFVRGGKNVVTGGIGDETAVLWDTATGKELRRFFHGASVENIAVSPEQSRILTFGGAPTFAKLWDLASGRNLQTFKYHHDLIVAGAFSPDGNRIFTASQDECVCEWSPDSTHPRHVVCGLNQLDAAAFAPDASSLVFRSKDKKVQLFDHTTGKIIKQLPVKPTPSNYINEGVTDHPIVFDEAGNLVAVYAEYWGLVVYEIKSGEPLWHVEVPDQFGMAFSPSNEDLFVISSDFEPPRDQWIMTTRLRIYDARTGSCRSESVLYSGDQRNAPVSSAVAFQPGGELLVSCHRGGTASGSASVLKRRDAANVCELKGSRNAINCLAISPKSNSIVVGDSTRYASFWDLTQGAVTATFGPHEIQPLDVRFDKAETVITDEPNFFRRWPSDGTTPPLQMDRQTTEGWLYPIRDDGNLALMFPGRGPRIDPNQPFATAAVLGFSDFFGELQAADVWRRGSESKPFSFHCHSFGPAIFGPDGSSVYAIRDDQVCKFDLSAGREVWSSKDLPETIETIAISRQSDRLLLGGHDDVVGVAQLWNAEDGTLIKRLVGHAGEVTSLAFSADGHLFATGDGDGKVLLWNSSHTKAILELKGHLLKVTAIAFFPDGNSIATGSIDGTIRLWKTADGSQVATLAASESGWVVTAPDGRFDTNNLDEIKGFHWVFADDPFRPLAPENYLRNYYVPKLLPHLLQPRNGEFNSQLPPLQSLNRARPKVLEVRIANDVLPGRVTAEVDVESGQFTFEQTGNTEVSGAYDLRLFRDGQLVGQFPGPKVGTPDGMAPDQLKNWQQDTLVVEAGGKRTVRFDNLQIPHQRGPQEVEFTAYAFNEVRIKSDVGKARVKGLPGSTLRKAYLIAIGVNDYGGSWDLQYAAKDAHQMSDVLPKCLEWTGFPLMETITLVSDDIDENATKEKIRVAIRDVANRSTPDDLVIIFFSGHGYSGKNLDFYLLTSDSQPGRVKWSDPSIDDLGRMIATDELSRWFHHLVADEIVLIIDACHSAASIEAEGFRPGPLGAKGLGQLAYDKRMRVLAASQSDQSAREMGGQIAEGVLTYTLLHDGIEANQAANQDGKITLQSWLNYPIKRVPHLFVEIRSGKINDFGVPIAKDALPVAHADMGAMSRSGALQNPALFDFARREGPIICFKSKPSA
jgi:WD40 repeat protein